MHCTASEGGLTACLARCAGFDTALQLAACLASVFRQALTQLPGSTCFGQRSLKAVVQLAGTFLARFLDSGKPHSMQVGPLQTPELVLSSASPWPIPTTPAAEQIFPASRPISPGNSAACLRACHSICAHHHRAWLPPCQLGH